MLYNPNILIVEGDIVFSSKKFLFLSLKLFSSFLFLMFFNCLCYGDNYTLTGNDLKDRYDCGYWRYTQNNGIYTWTKYNPVNTVKEDVLHLTSYDCHRNSYVAGTWGSGKAIVSEDLTFIDPNSSNGYGPTWAPYAEPVDLSSLTGSGITTPKVVSDGINLKKFTLLDKYIIGVGGPFASSVEAPTGIISDETHSCEPTATFKLLDLKTFTSLKAIGAASFQNRKLEDGEYEVTDNAIKNLTIPDQCHYIGRAAFKGNVCLKTVNITCQTLDHIETSSFEDCDAIDQFSFSMSADISDFVENLKNENEITFSDNSVQAFAKYYYDKGYTVSTSEDGKTLYINRAPLKIKNIDPIFKTISDSPITIDLRDTELSMNLTDYGKSQTKPTKSDYELYVRAVSCSTITNWLKVTDEVSIEVNKPGRYVIQYAAISKNSLFKSSHNELRNENNHLIYKDENGTDVDLGEVESQ